MDFISKLEEAIAIYQPKIESIMNTQLGKVTIRNPLPPWEMYFKIKNDDVYVAFTGGLKILALELTGDVIKQQKAQFIYASGMDNNMEIFIGGQDKSVLSTNDINYLAAHELAHLSHKKKVGYRIIRCWPEDETEMLAEYVSLSIVKGRLRYFRDNRLENLKDFEIYMRAGIEAYINDRAGNIRQNAISEPLIANIIL